MTTVYLLALILAINGDRMTIDKGIIDGLQPGDIGSVYYTLTINATREKTIEVGKCEVLTSDDFTAVVRAIGQRSPIRENYSVRFSRSAERTSPAALLALAKERLQQGKLDVALVYLRRVRKVLPDDATVASLIEETVRRKEGGQRKQAEAKQPEPKPAVDAWLSAAVRALGDEHYKEALGFVERVLKLQPENKQALALKEGIETERDRRATMFLISGGQFSFGLEKAQARFYNQQPRFQSRLDSFWVDRSATGLVGLSSEEAEAYCRKLGKRLPTEFELEAAAARPDFAASKSAEWTSSWYLPYPGNSVKENEYGQTYRVIRGPDDFRVRTFLLPEERALDTSFRCACDDRTQHGIAEK